MNTENKKQSVSLIMHIPFIAISLLGFGGIVIVKNMFDTFIKNSLLADGVMPIANDNFYLYYNISLSMCAVLLGLTLLSSVTYVLQTGTKSKFSRLTVITAPILCACAMIMLSVFYSYLTYDSNMPITSYLVILGVCEAALFLFPMMLSRLAIGSNPAKNAKQSDKPSKRK